MWLSQYPSCYMQSLRNLAVRVEEGISKGRGPEVTIRSLKVTLHHLQKCPCCLRVARVAARVTQVEEPNHDPQQKAFRKNCDHFSPGLCGVLVSTLYFVKRSVVYSVPTSRRRGSALR